jgi:hypothetical protein
MMDQVELIKTAPNDEYIGKIRKRLQEDASARAEREKRRRKVLVDQMKAHESQEVTGRWFSVGTPLCLSTVKSHFEIWN